MAGEAGGQHLSTRSVAPLVPIAMMNPKTGTTMMRRRAISTIFLGCVALAACTGGPTPWKQPALAMPPTWSNAAEGASGERQNWWQEFNDPQLNALVDRVLRTNNDFAAAAVRVRRSQLLATLTGANSAPSLAAGAGTGVSRSIDPVSTQRSSGTFASFNYELDIWGKLASERAASRKEVQATQADCRAFADVLVGTTVKLYWRVAYLNGLLAMDDVDIESAEKTASMTYAKLEAGATSGTNAADVELAVLTLQSARRQVLQRRVEARNALAILFDQPPGVVVSEPSQLPEGPLPPIGAGLPAQILANRSDLRAAELRLREALDEVDVMRTSFYPTLSLTGNLGTASNSLVDLVRSPAATLGSGLALPFLGGPNMELATKVSQSQYEEAVLDFRQKLYAALAEVENDLSERAQVIADEETLRLEVEQARRAESIARARFEAGASDIQLWLDAQQRVRAIERSLLANRLSQFDNLADLYRALGIGVSLDPRRCGIS
jgi:NodT family efflux transporter outer membrane factor (OMF) lipoprotein